MYSKDKGFTRAPMGESRADYRPHRAPRVSVPPNYRGHAIVDGEERPLGSLADTPPRPSAESIPAADTPVPRFDGLPRVSQLGDSRRHHPPAFSVDFPYDAHTTDSPASSYDGEDSDGSTFREIPHKSPSDTHSHDENPPKTNQNHVSPSTLPHRHENPQNPSRSYLPPPNTTEPPIRAHGILSLGLEELLLLGLILFLLREGGDCTDRGDLDETVILLGLLLLLG